MRSIAIVVSASLSVYSLAYLKNDVSKLHEIYSYMLSLAVAW